MPAKGKSLPREAVIARSVARGNPVKMLKFIFWIAAACKQRKPRNDGLTGETELLQRKLA